MLLVHNDYFKNHFLVVIFFGNYYIYSLKKKHSQSKKEADLLVH